MTDQFRAESIVFAKNLSEEARQSALELGLALGRAVDDIPALESILDGLKGPEREALKRHLSALHVFRRFVEQTQSMADSMPAA